MAYIMQILVLSFVYALLIPSSAPHHSDSLSSAHDVSLIIVGFRHGYRNPAQFFKNDTTREESGWGWEGASQLTNIGKQQAFSLGKFLNNRYSILLPKEFNPSQVKAVSSSAERCQMTLQCVLAGAFPPITDRSIWDRTLKWQPIPYTINDPMLRMYNVKCPTYSKAYQPISDDNLHQSREWLNDEKTLIDYITKNTGFNGSLSDLADVADNIQSIIYTKGMMPHWIEHPTLPGFNKTQLIKEILEYAEAHQIQCAVERSCAKSMAGLWLDEILSILNKKKQGKIDERKAQFYAAHTETVLSLMKLLKMNVTETPTSAGFIIEFKSTPEPSIRTLFHEPSPTNHKQRLAHVASLPYCPPETDGWCNLDTVVRAVRQESFADWQEFCELPKCAV